MGGVVPKIIEDEKPSSPRALNETVIPEYIIVKDGYPTDKLAAVFDVPFKDYIKNVSCSEVYATWPKECLKANILCIITFTLHRVFTEWYRTKGYTFTITSSPAYDQKYSENQTIFESVSQAVDEIFDQYIVEKNKIKPFFAQYNDGKVVNNAGWLSQWGSKELADQGYSAIQILRHYYGANINLNTAEEVKGVPFSFPGYVLEEGICGDAVQKLQAELNIISSSFPKIPKIVPANGKYNAETIAAVTVFQEVFNLPQTGIVDFATWYRIANIYIGVMGMLKGRYIFSS